MTDYYSDSAYNTALDVDTLCAWFPEFSDKTVYPSAFVASAGKQARMWISREGCAHLNGEEREYAFCCMVGHLILMTIKERNAANGGTSVPGGGSASGVSGQVGGSGLIQSASVGGVSVSMQVPQYFKGAWDWWLGQTPYGQKLLAFLSSRTPVAVYGYGDDIRGCLRD